MVNRFFVFVFPFSTFKVSPHWFLTFIVSDQILVIYLTQNPLNLMRCSSLTAFKISLSLAFNNLIIMCLGVSLSVSLSYWSSLNFLDLQIHNFIKFGNLGSLLLQVIFLFLSLFLLGFPYTMCMLVCLMVPHKSLILYFSSLFSPSAS